MPSAGSAVIDLTPFIGVSLPMQLESYSYAETPIVEDGLGRTLTAIKAEGTGFLDTVDETTLAAAIAAISAVTTVSGTPLTITGIGGVVQHQVLPPTCVDGGPHVGFDVLEQNSSVHHREIKFTLSAKTIGSSALNVYKKRIVTLPDGRERVTQTGSLSGGNVQALFASIVLQPFLLGCPPGLFVTTTEVEYPAGGNGSSSGVQCRYTLTAMELASQLPAGGITVGAVDGTVVFRQDRDEQQRLLTTTEYDLQLSTTNWSEIYTIVRPTPTANAQIIRESCAFTSVRELRLRASFQVLSSAENAGLLNYRREITLTTGDSFEEITYPGIAPIAVQKATIFPRLRDQGSATGIGAFPTAPDPLLDTDEQPRVITLTDVSEAEKQTTWNYQQLVTDGSTPSIGDYAGQIGRNSVNGNYGGDGGPE